MTALEFLPCGNNDARWNDYFLLLMRHYDELTLPYGFRIAFSFIGDPIMRGDALLVLDAGGRTAGALGFVYPSEESGGDAETRVCQVEAVFLRREIRDGAAFYLLLQAFSVYLAAQTPEIGTIRFWSPAEREDLRKLFGKFCRLVKTSAKDFGRIDLYETSRVHLARYVSRWRGAQHE